MRLSVFLVLLFSSLFLSCVDKKGSSKDQPNKVESTNFVVQNSGTLTDIDGNVYRYLEMCDGVKWMAENLNVSHYRNGDEIPHVQDPEEWATLKTGAWSYYLNDGAYGQVYGKLYNWYAVNDPRGLAPEGWRVSSKNNWINLADCLGGPSLAGGSLKEIGTFHWMSPNVGAVNSSGFSALPAGGRSAKGEFSMVENLGAFWTLDTYDELQAWIRHLSYSNTYLVDFYNDKRNGFSVRCVKE